MTDQLLYFEPDLGVVTPVRVVTSVPTVTERVVIDSQPREAYKTVAEDAWGWEELRDYVALEITTRFGVFPRDSRKECGIFKSFMGRWADSITIARFAFEVHDGRWRGAPVRMQRFCKNSDPYFAQPIHDYLINHT